MDCPEIRIRRTTRHDGETWIDWAVFPRTLSGYRMAITARNDFGPGYYNGPGRSFGRPAHITARGSRILVTQYHGLDI